MATTMRKQEFDASVKSYMFILNQMSEYFKVEFEFRDSFKSHKVDSTLLMGPIFSEGSGIDYKSARDRAFVNAVSQFERFFKVNIILKKRDSRHCCELRCFRKPDCQVDGVACDICFNYSYCICKCESFRLSNVNLKADFEKRVC